MRHVSNGDGQGNGRCLDVRHPTSSAFKDINVGQVAKSWYPSESHDLSAGWAKRWLWGVFTRVFVAHGQSGPWPRRPDTLTGRPFALSPCQNSAKLSYTAVTQIRIFGDEQHMGDIHRNPPRLVAGEQLGRRSPAGLTFEINVSELLAVVVAQASCCSTDRLRWLCARCRRKCCAAAWLSYRERNRPPCVAACSWRVLIGKCGPTESTPGVLQSP